MDAELDVDLAQLPQGQTYEDRYRGYLRVFERIASQPGFVRVIVHNAPWSWVPLLNHLMCDVRSATTVFEHCAIVRDACLSALGPFDYDRTMIEVLCGFRPETVDALWKCDRQWDLPDGRARRYDQVDEFIVTSNGSFDRQEIKDYEEYLREYRPTKKKVVLVPCAADKPYPAPMHKAVLEIMPDDFYMMNVTGVVGLIPQELWPVMPHYDSGIPNEWRVYNAVRKYFDRFEHQRIIGYLDFYSEPTRLGISFTKCVGRDEWVLPVQFYADYLDLMKTEHLAELKALFDRGF